MDDVNYEYVEPPTKRPKLDRDVSLDDLLEENRSLLVRCDSLVIEKEQLEMINTQTNAKIEQMEEELKELRRQLKPFCEVFSPISLLPREMLFSILSYLPLLDIIRSSRTCSFWNNAVTSWLISIDLSPLYPEVNDKTIRAITKYVNLQTLCLARCKEVTSKGLHDIVFSFSSLLKLDIFGCSIPNITPLKELTSLEYLRLGHSQGIKDCNFEVLPTSLTELNLDWCLDLSDTGLLHLSRLTRLENLSISSCPGLKPNSALPAGLIPSLKHLHIARQSGFTDDPLSHLKHFTNLQSLELHWVPISGIGFRSFSSLTNLTSLKLSRCQQFCNQGLEHVAASLPHLEILEIRGPSSLTDAGLLNISLFSKLRSLCLCCGKIITDQGLIFLNSLTLTSLTLRECHNLTVESIKLIKSSQFKSLINLNFTQAKSIPDDMFYSLLSKENMPNLKDITFKKSLIN